jgi:macrophage erythroblast attacher
VDAHVFVEAQKVLDALRAHDCGPALAWCAQHAAKLRKIKSHSLEFKLRLQVHCCAVNHRLNSTAVIPTTM